LWTLAFTLYAVEHTTSEVAVFYNGHVGVVPAQHRAAV